jgi:hypothetical protein
MFFEPMMLNLSNNQFVPVCASRNVTSHTAEVRIRDQVEEMNESNVLLTIFSNVWLFVHQFNHQLLMIVNRVIK